MTADEQQCAPQPGDDTMAQQPHASLGWWAAARSCDAGQHRRNNAEQRDEMRLLRSRIAASRQSDTAGGSSCDTFRSSSRAGSKKIYAYGRRPRSRLRGWEG